MTNAATTNTAAGLSYEQTVPRSMAHRTNLGEVLITDSAATDYRVLRTGPMRPPLKEALASADYPLWLSWGIPLSDTLRRTEVAELVVAQLREAKDRVTGARIDYYRARVLPDGHVVGRAKLAVSLVDGVPEDDIPGLLSELCPWAQRESVARLLNDDLPVGAIRLRLAWRERWLGHTGTVA